MQNALLDRLASAAAATPRPRVEVSDSEAELSSLFAEISASGRSLLPAAASRPVRAVRIARLLLALHRVAVTLPDGPERAAVERALRSNALSRRATLGVTAVLDLPAAHEDYLQGHDRASVRRKVRAAERQGIVVRPVPERDRPRLKELADAHERTNERPEYRCADPRNDDLLDVGLWLAAFDGTGRPIALAVIPVSGTWATLRYFRTLEPGRASSDARYLLASELATALSLRGVEHLADTTRPHWLPNGLRHFQRMLGFRLVRIGSSSRADAGATASR